MASFNADILLKLTGVGRAEAEVKKLEKTINKVGDAAQKIAIGGLQGGTKLATRNVKEYINTLGKLDKRLGGLGGRLADVAKAFDFGGKTVVGIAGLNALSSALQSLPRWAGGANGALQGFASSLEAITAPINVVTDALQAMGPAGMATAGGIAATTAAVMAFGPAVRRAGKQAEEFRRSFSGSFEVSQDLLSEKTLRDALGAAVAEQKKLSAGTREYTQKTEEVLGIQRELTAELRRQETVLNMVNKTQIDIAKNVQKNINASAQARKASGFADFSQRAGAQTAIDKSIRRQQEKLARRAQSAPGATGPLMLPSSEMLNAAERGIKRIRSVTDQLGEDLDYTNQEVANFINGLKTGANEAVKLPPIFNKVAQSLDVINNNFDSATAKAKRLAGGAAGGTGSTTPIQGRTAALRQLAALETKLIGEVAATRAKKDLQSYNTRQKRLRYLAAQEKKAADDRAKRTESLALGVGFPLLFGGGAGSIAGSALGSFAGDGFGGQIIGGAIGQSLDSFVQGIGELGQALNPVTADVTKVVEAAGLAGTELGKTITELENTAGSAVALKEATKELERVVGEDGVQALQEFGERFTTLGNQLAEFFTQVQVAVAKLLQETPTERNLRTTGETIFQARRSDNTDIQDAISRLDSSSVPNERLAIQKEIVALVEQEAQARERELEALAASTGEAAAKRREVAASVEEKRIELEIERLNAVANDETRIALEQKLAFQQLMTEQQALYNQFATDQITIDVLRLKLAGARLDYETKLAKIANAAANYKPPGGGGGGGVDKEAQAQKTIATELTKQFELETKMATLNVSKLDKINIELQRLEAKKALKVAELELSNEDSRVLAAKLETLNLETGLLRQQLEIQRQRLQLEQQMASLKGEQDIANLERSLNQELAGLTLPTGDRFADEQNALDLKQQQRYANVMADINQQIERQNLLLTDPTKAEAAQKQIDFLNRQKAVYEQLLPAIGQAEQQQLKFNQALSLVEGPVNAFVGGLTDGLMGLIDGTKSAEEAFADMLKGMGQALIQTAAQMIAQYIAIGIARAFAGMGGGSSFSDVNGTNYYNPTTGLGNAGPNFGLAEGGFVDRPMTAMIGEGSSDEYVIPSDKMASAMQRYNAGARGEAVVNGASSTEEGGMMLGADAPINISTGPVMAFEGKNYVTQDEFAAGVQSAAKQGEARALRRLQMSPSARRKAGVR